MGVIDPIFMKKYFYFLFVVSLICTNSEAKKIPGFFINKEGDTVCVTFDVTFGFFGQDAKIERIQEKIRYYDSLNNKNTLKPEDASEVVIVNSGDTIECCPRQIIWGWVLFIQEWYF